MIERGIIEALHNAPKGSKQELQAKALKAVFDVVSTDSFQDVQIPSAEKPTQLNLEAEWQRQANRFIDLDFHKELKQSKQQYLESLPQFAKQP